MQTANGKAILFGEHFVVYESRAVAVAIEPGANATIRTSERPNFVVPMWDFDALKSPNSDLSRAFHALWSCVDSLHGPLVSSTVSVDCFLPAGAGLGSSGAIGVATARALLAQLYGSVDIDPDDLHRMVMTWESIFHGNPSGFDHAVSMRRGAVIVDPAATPRFSEFRPEAPLHFAIIVAESGASTSRMVDGVASFRSANRTRFDGILGEANLVIDEGILALKRADVEVIGTLMTRNHLLLERIGVSTPALNRCVEQLHAWGAEGAKLTGAGGGGAVIAITASATVQSQLVARALEQGLEAFSATVPIVS